MMSTQYLRQIYATGHENSDKCCDILCFTVTFCCYSCDFLWMKKHTRYRCSVYFDEKINAAVYYALLCHFAAIGVDFYRWRHMKNKRCFSAPSVSSNDDEHLFPGYIIYCEIYHF